MSSKGKMSERLTMQGGIHKAYKVLLKLIHPKYMKKDKQIPLNVIKNAKGIAFITTIKAGFVWTGTVGTGIVIARLDNGEWSGPSSIGTGGMGWGLQIGASSTDSVLILNTKSAVKAFSGKGQIKFGGNLSIAAGPVGRDADGSVSAGDGGVAAVYSYAHSRGAFAGLSLQGAVLFARDSDNAKFYGQKISATTILSGAIPPPENEDLRLLYKTLRVICNSETDNYEYRDEYTGSMRDVMEAESSMNTSYASTPAAYPDDSDTLGPTAVAYPTTSAVEEVVKPDVHYPTSQLKATGLPDGWRELTTADGQTYYWNEKEGITQWERPEPPVTRTAPPAPPPREPSSYASGWGGASSSPTPSTTTTTTTTTQDAYSSGWGSSAAAAAAPAVISYGTSNSNWGGGDNTTASTYQAELSRALSSKATLSAATTAAPVVASASPAYQAELSRALSTKTSTAQSVASRPQPAVPTPSSRPIPPVPSSSTAPRPTPPVPGRPSSFRSTPEPSSPTPAPAPAFRPPVQPTQPSSTPSAPTATTTPSAAEKSYSYNEVCSRQIPGMDVTRLEAYLTDEEFARIFKMDRSAFQQLPKWKRDKTKKDVHLF